MAAKGTQLVRCPLLSRQSRAPVNDEVTLTVTHWPGDLEEPLTVHRKGCHNLRPYSTGLRGHLGMSPLHHVK